MDQWLEYSPEQSRQFVDVEMVFSEFEISKFELEQRFAGSMFWARAGADEYLRRKVKGVVKYEGKRSAETEAQKVAFDKGKARVEKRVKELRARLKEMAPVNRALRLGRVPEIVVKIVSAITKANVLETITIVGTNAIFAYEATAAVMLSGGITSTGDIDLLYDARRSLRLITEKLKTEGLIGLLKKADASFEKRARYRATNSNGYMVDLIEPLAKDTLRQPAHKIGSNDDLEAAEIQGLQWLINSPKIHPMVISQRGYPLRLRVPDPRFWSLHKLWLASREDRDVRRRTRDKLQGLAVAELIRQGRMRPGFDKIEDLAALPVAVRQLIPK